MWVSAGEDVSRFVAGSIAASRRGACGIGVARRARSASDAVRCGPRVVGTQAFYYAKAFNKNIGGWNTASVSNMNAVCTLPPSRTSQRATEVRTRQWPCASSRGAKCGLNEPLGRSGPVPGHMWASAAGKDVSRSVAGNIDM